MNTVKPLVSIVIPTRNRLAFLKEAIASVSAQDFPEFETIVVDDASDDGTWEWLSSLRDPQIQVFRLPQHAERSAARNLGLTEANGHFVMFLDDDDLLSPTALSYLAGAAQRWPDALAVVGGQIYFDEQGHWFKPHHPRWTVRRRIWADVLSGWAPHTGRFIIRRSAVVGAGGWLPGLSVAEDHELWLRMVCSESTLVVLPGIVKYMRQHLGQTRIVGYRRRDLDCRRAFARRLPASLRELGASIIQAQRIARAAGMALSRRQYRKASRLYTAAILKAPGLLRSPLVREMLLGELARSLFYWFLSPNLVALGRRTKARFRQLVFSDANQHSHV